MVDYKQCSPISHNVCGTWGYMCGANHFFPLAPGPWLRLLRHMWPSVHHSVHYRSGQLDTERAPCHPPGLHKYWPALGHGQLGLQNNFNRAKITWNGRSGITAPKGYFIPALSQRFSYPSPKLLRPMRVRAFSSFRCPLSLLFLLQSQIPQFFSLLQLKMMTSLWRCHLAHKLDCISYYFSKVIQSKFALFFQKRPCVGLFS